MKYLPGVRVEAVWVRVGSVVDRGAGWEGVVPDYRRPYAQMDIRGNGQMSKLA